MKPPKHVLLILSKAKVDANQCRFSYTNNQHIRIDLPNGKQITCAGTPSDWRGNLNKAAQIRRLMRESH